MTIDADRGLLEALLPVVLAAGRIEMNYFDAGVEVQTKADATPVTVADHEAEVVLVDGLNKVAPGVPVIAEESVAAGKVPETGGEFFLVDPLDGTRAFIACKPDFTINIGLIRDNQPVFGIIYAPALGKFFATLSPQTPWRLTLRRTRKVSDWPTIRSGRCTRAIPIPTLWSRLQAVHMLPMTQTRF